jgi:hypothetical protein
MGKSIMSFNITCRADNKADLKAEIESQAEEQVKQKHLPKEIKAAIDALVEATPEVKGGYLQFTTFGHIDPKGPSNVIFNLSSHASE